MMIAFHAAFNVYYFSDYGLDIHEMGWRILGRSTAVIFITLVGISLTLSYSKAKEEKSGKALHIKYIYRGGKIFSWGILISVLTYFFLQESFIIFGILHFIGLSIIIAYPLVRYRNVSLLLGSISIITGYLIWDVEVGFRWLLWLGLRPHGFTTVDYFPLFPWLGVLLIGIFIGNTLYPGRERKFSVPDLSNHKIVEIFCLLGRNSLKIYLLHQPVLIAILYLSGIIHIPFL